MKDPIFLRTSFTEKLTFTAKPNAATRKALVAAGFRWNGTQWWRNRNQTGVIKPKQLADILVPDTSEVPANDNVPQPELAATA